MTKSPFPKLDAMMADLLPADKPRALEWIEATNGQQHGPIEIELLRLMVLGHAKIIGFVEAGPLIAVDRAGERAMQARFGPPLELPPYTPDNGTVH